MMGATVGTDPHSKAELLKVAVDPAAASQRLQELLGKAEEASNILAQAREQNLQALNSRNEAEALNAATVDLMQKQASKEADLKQREQALYDKSVALDVSASRLADAKQQFEQDSAARDADLAKREKAMQQRETDSAAKIAQDQADANSALAAQKASLEAAYKAKMDDLARQQQQLDANLKAAQDAQAAAENTRLAYEAKLADLRKLVGT